MLVGAKSSNKELCGAPGSKNSCLKSKPLLQKRRAGRCFKDIKFFFSTDSAIDWSVSAFKFQTSQNGQRLKTSRKNYLKCEWMKRGPFSFFKPHRQACIRQHQSVLLSRGIMAGAGRCQTLHQQQLLLLYHNLFCFQAKRPPDSYLGFCWCWKKLQIGTTRAKQTRDKETLGVSGILDKNIKLVQLTKKNKYFLKYYQSKSSVRYDWQNPWFFCNGN